MPSSRRRWTARHLPRAARASFRVLSLTAPSVPRTSRSRRAHRRGSRAPVAGGVHQCRRRLGRESCGASGTSRTSPRPPPPTRSPRTFVQTQISSPLEPKTFFSREFAKKPVSSDPAPVSTLHSTDARRETNPSTRADRRWPRTPRSRGTSPGAGGTRNTPAGGTSGGRGGARMSATSPARVLAPAAGTAGPPTGATARAALHTVPRFPRPCPRTRGPPAAGARCWGTGTGARRRGATSGGAGTGAPLPAALRVPSRPARRPSGCRRRVSRAAPAPGWSPRGRTAAGASPWGAGAAAGSAAQKILSRARGGARTADLKGARARRSRSAAARLGSASNPCASGSGASCSAATKAKAARRCARRCRAACPRPRSPSGGTARCGSSTRTPSSGRFAPRSAPAPRSPRRWTPTRCR